MKWVHSTLINFFSCFLLFKYPRLLYIRLPPRLFLTILSYFVTEKRGSEKHTAHRLSSTNPDVHALPIHFTHTDLRSLWHSNFLLTPSSMHYRSKTYTNNNKTDHTTFHLLPRLHTHRCQPRTLSHCITGYVHSPKAQACFSSDVHKTPIFPVLSSLSLSLSLSFLYSSSLTDY
jgi:hypothetical protein